MRKTTIFVETKKQNAMMKLSLKIATIIGLVSLFFYTISLMKNEPNTFDPEKEWKYMLENVDSTEVN